MKSETPKQTPYERFEDALKRVLSVPKTEVDKRVKEAKKARKPKN